MAIYKKNEFKAFLKTIKWGSVEHWQDIARALNVEEDTITAWKRTPEAQAAIEEGIDRALKAMEQAGAKDWRMWEAKLKMLGVNPPEKHEIKTADPIELLLKKYVNAEGKNDRQTPEAISDSSQSST